MTLNDGFDRTVSTWLRTEAGEGTPRYLDEVLVQTIHTRQRPAWSSLERWLPMETTFQTRTAPVPKLAWALVLLAVLVLSAAMFMVIGPGHRRLPQFGQAANGEIAYVDGDTLKVADANGTNVRSAAALPGDIEGLAFSPDGTRLAYRTTAESPAIVVSDADGSHPIVVPEGADVGAGGPIAWSSDSRRIAFTGVTTSGLETIDVMNADGSNRRQVFADAEAAPTGRFHPAWSPDGHWISFLSREANGYVGLNVVHPDGSEATRLSTSPLNPDFLQASWSPDPRDHRIAYVAGGYVKVWDFETSRETTVGKGFWATWSPDGRSIAWFGDGVQVAAFDDLLVGNRRVLLLFPPVSGVCPVLAKTGSMAGSTFCGPAQWSPDGAWVYGPDATGRSITLAPTDGSKVYRTITLDHPMDMGLGPLWHVAWQPVAP